MIRVKICGITNHEDALACSGAGADALGFIFVPGTPRYISPSAANDIISRLPPFVSTVGVFMDQDKGYICEAAAESGVDAVQLHGGEDPVFCQNIGGTLIKRFTVKSDDDPTGIQAEIKRYSGCFPLIDPGCGSGLTFDWNILKALSGDIIVAGGLNPENLEKMLSIKQPWGVDACSGVECELGRKDHEQVREFLRIVKCFSE